MGIVSSHRVIVLSKSRPHARFQNGLSRRNNSLYVKIIFIVCVHVNIVARKCYTNKIPLDRLLVIAYMSHAGQNSPSETLNISVCGAVKICQKASLKYHVSVTERVKIIQVLLDGNKYLFYFTPCNSLHISQHV